MDTFDAPFEFQSKMNPNLDKIPSEKFPSPNDIFGQSDDDEETESPF